MPQEFKVGEREIMTHTYKFTPGQIFKLAPHARISWLVFGNLDQSCVQAVRMDTDLGKRLHDWLMAGGDRSNKPATYEEVVKAARDFWPHDLEGAELA
jgi:hypothetical protein